MSDLQISLIGIGIAVVLALYAYSWLQQRRYRRKFGAAFRHGHEDVLYRPVTVESVHKPPSGKVEQEGSSLAFNDEPHRPNVADEICALLDPTSDYVAKISPKSLTGADALARLWQQRFDFGKNLNVCGLNVASGEWEKIIPESRLPYATYKLALQLVNRSGAISEARLEEFRDLIRLIATQLEADVTLPDVTVAFARGQTLDKFCAAVDQLIGLNIMPGDDCLLSGGEIARAAEHLDMSLQTDGSFHRFDAQGHSLFSLGNFDNTPFQHHTLGQLRVRGLTLLLDVPRVEQPTQRFDEMLVLARQLAIELDAAMVDDHYVALSEAGIALIRDQIAAIEADMLSGNIIPGSAQARRLFS